MILLTMDKETIRLFWVYGRGCAKHLPYRGNKPPSDCERCKAVYRAKVALEQLAPDPQEVGIVYDPRCLLCGTGKEHTMEEHVRELANEKRGV
jgi:hypothetical protein